MKPETRAKPKSASAMTRPRNQSAFQNAVFIAGPSYRRRPRASPAHVNLRARAFLPRELRQLGGDDEVLDRHALGFEEGGLLRGGPSGTGARDHLAQLHERPRVQAAFLAPG